VDCAPVLDVPVDGAHKVIGDRAFSDSPEINARLGIQSCRGFMEHGIIPVIKHLPGHGRAMEDSHEKRPVIDAPVDELIETDFYPFSRVAEADWGKDIYGMVAHVVIKQVDEARPATTSARVIKKIIRDEIGFDGLLIADDITMKALHGDMLERALQTLEAGCDITLHCSGRLSQMKEIGEDIPILTEAAIDRLNRAEKRRLEMSGEKKPLSMQESEEADQGPGIDFGVNVTD
jgi:beta-N-acetylhexosaminidase